MNRERAIDLAEHLLRNLDDGQETWPLSLVTEVYVFGSFARGALTPGDLDIDVEKTSDQQWSTHFVRSLSSGRDPFIALRKALTTGRRGYQFVFQYQDMDGTDFEMTLLWKRGDTLDAAMKRLHAIQIDPAAGRAERDSMLPEFEGIDDWIPRPYREGLCGAVGSGAIRVERLVLPTAGWQVLSRQGTSRGAGSPPAPCSALRRRWLPTGSNGASTPDRATCTEPTSETGRRLTSPTSTGPTSGPFHTALPSAAAQNGSRSSIRRGTAPWIACASFLWTGRRSKSCAGSCGWSWRTRSSTSTTHAASPVVGIFSTSPAPDSNPVHRVEIVSPAPPLARRGCPRSAGAGTHATSPLA